jgi:hypothetical protein
VAGRLRNVSFIEWDTVNEVVVPGGCGFAVDAGDIPFAFGMCP